MAVQAMGPVFSEGGSAGGRRSGPFHKGGSSLWMDEQTANTSA